MKECVVVRRCEYSWPTWRLIGLCNTVEGKKKKKKRRRTSVNDGKLIFKELEAPDHLKNGEKEQNVNWSVASSQWSGYILCPSAVFLSVRKPHLSFPAVCESYRKGDVWKNVLWNTDLVQLVQWSSVHVFHAVVDTGFDEKCAIKVHDVRALRFVEDIQLHQDRVEFALIQFQANFLRWICNLIIKEISTTLWFEPNSCYLFHQNNKKRNCNCTRTKHKTQNNNCNK